MMKKPIHHESMQLLPQSPIPNPPDPPEYDTSERITRQKADPLNERLHLGPLLDKVMTTRVGGIYLENGVFRKIENKEKAILEAGTIEFRENNSVAHVPSIKIQTIGSRWGFLGETFKNCTLREKDWPQDDWQALISYQRHNTQSRLTSTTVKRTERAVAKEVKAEDAAAKNSTRKSFFTR